MKTMKSIVMSLITITVVSTGFTADYFPLAVGNYWTFDVMTGGGKKFPAHLFNKKIKCESKSGVIVGTATLLIAGDTVYEGTRYYTLMSISSFLDEQADTANSFILQKDQFVYFLGSLDTPSEEYEVMGKKMFQDNEWYLDRGDTMRVYVEPEITVGEKIYTDCFIATNDDSLDGVQLSYAPDIGLIRIASVDNFIVLNLTDCHINLTPIKPVKPIARKNQRSSIMIFDCKGRQIASYNTYVSNLDRLLPSGCATGIYYCRIQRNNGIYTIPLFKR